jgi:hypothetical protein
MHCRPPKTARVVPGEYIAVNVRARARMYSVVTINYAQGKAREIPAAAHFSWY